jgi:hypothetical protein
MGSGEFVDEAKENTIDFFTIKSMKGMNRSRCSPFLYSSLGGRFEVTTTTLKKIFKNNYLKKKSEKKVYKKLKKTEKKLKKMF